MSQVSLPVTRTSGRALLVGNPSSRASLRETLERLGYDCTESDDPYAAMAELCRRPLNYRALILSVAGLYREELTIIRAIKRRFPHAEVWLAQTDGRQAALAESMRLGADGLLDDDGLHRIALSASPADETGAGPFEPHVMIAPAMQTADESARAADAGDADANADAANSGEPILSAEELRALLQEQPTMPPAGGEE